MTIKVLDKTTIQHLHSGQVIVDLEAIVKELIENSLDANATSIEVVFINNGLESIQVKDDGDGIEENDRLCVAKRHYTSKLVKFDDLESISSYGFRGEALNSMCAISENAIIMTKTKEDVIGKQYDVDKEGFISNEKPTNSISKSGTNVTLYKPFYNLPVRRQLAKKNIPQSTRKFQDLIVQYALAHPNVRFSSHQARDTVGYIPNTGNNSWIKPATTSIEKTIGIIYGSQLANAVERFVETDIHHPTLTIDMILPKRNSDPSVIYKGGDRVFVYVNQRPINYVKSELKELVTSVRNRYRENVGLNENNRKNPFMYIDIQMSPDEYDVNIDPNKTTIYFQNKQLIFNLVDKILDTVYSNKIDSLFIKQTEKGLPNVANLEQKSDEELVISESPTVEKGITTECSVTTPEIVSPRIKGSAAPEPSVPRSPSSSVNMDHSWSFSMMSDDEEDDEPIDDVANVGTQQNKLERTTISAPAMDWQIDALSSVDGPVSTLPKTNNVSSSPAITIPENDDTTVAHDTFDTYLPTKTASIIPPFTIPQKRALLDDSSVNDDLKKHTTKRISSSYTSRHQQTQETSDIVEDFLVPPFQSMNAVSLNRLASSKLMACPKLTCTQQQTSSAVAQPLQRKTNAPASTIKPTTQLSLLQAFSHRARNSTKFSSPVPTPAPAPAINSSPQLNTSTLNKSFEIQCNFNEIKANYSHFKKQHDKTYQASVGEYLMVSCRQKSLNIEANARLISTTTINGLSFYSLGNASELGVVRLKAMNIDVIYNQLWKDHKIICKKTLDRPVQIQFREEDPLCAALLTLDTKEVVVEDDLHGNKQVPYYEIIEDCIVWNGFKARWRKDYNSHNLIIQFTSIYSLESGYNSADFREILRLLDESKSFVRPKKICDYLWSLAEKMYEQDENRNMPDLQEMLQSLRWKRDEIAEDLIWELGISTNGHLLACKLTDSSL
ncbi:hypothetical protein [Parasitella parasitica]|uniref:DNA mismatch repair protein S5 domain-containing protein n=1 Tax=Parasitella parasitica TaxID=35722 RepID=A0A0B7NHB4_9FUNG|nr:hypothetical protein [Parasitella parasitica]